MRVGFVNHGARPRQSRTSPTRKGAGFRRLHKQSDQTRLPRASDGTLPMKLNRAALIKALKSQEAAVGYSLDTELPDDQLLASIKSIIAEHNIELDGTEGETVDTIFARKEAPKPRLKLAVSAESGEIIEVGNKATRVNAAMHADPKALANIQARKNYTRRANAAAGASHSYGDGKAKWADGDQAEEAAAFIRLAVAGSLDYPQKARDLEVAGKTMITTTNTLGGAFVPEDYAAQLISLREMYGTAITLARRVPMKNDTLTMPRRTGGYTVYQVGEAASITASDAATDNVSLTAKKLGAMARVSRELFSDSAINIADFVADELAYAFAEKLDDCYLNGDGTSTYFGYDGIRPRIKGLDSTIANIAGLYVATDNLFSELDPIDFEGTVGLLPSYVSNPYWVCHQRFYSSVMVRLAQAQGGATATEMAGGIQRTFLGYPVKICQKMPRADGNSQVSCLFGDLAQGSMVGEVRAMEIAQSDQRYFDTDEIAIRALIRVAINVHDVGNASATEASRVPGPIVGLITAAS